MPRDNKDKAAAKFNALDYWDQFDAAVGLASRPDVGGGGEGSLPAGWMQEPAALVYGACGPREGRGEAGESKSKVVSQLMSHGA